MDYCLLGVLQFGKQVPTPGSSTFLQTAGIHPAKIYGITSNYTASSHQNANVRNSYLTFRDYITYQKAN